MKRNKRYKEDIHSNNSSIIVDMNDLKAMMREFIIHQIDRDMEDVVKKYMDEKILGDNNNINI